MLRILMSLGMAISIGSGLMAFEMRRQMQADPDAAVSLASAFAGLQDRAVSLMAPAEKRDPRQANLPQIKKPTVSAGMIRAGGSVKGDWSTMSNQQQVDALMDANPQLRSMVEASQQDQRQGFWARIRQKVTAPTGGGRLDAIQQRNAPASTSQYSPEALAKMDPAEMARNIGEIQKGLQSELTENLKNMRLD